MVHRVLVLCTGNRRRAEHLHVTDHHHSPRIVVQKKSSDPNAGQTGFNDDHAEPIKFMFSAGREYSSAIQHRGATVQAPPTHR